MSLDRAVLAIATEMEKEETAFGDILLPKSLLSSYARQLRLVVQAAEGQSNNGADPQVMQAKIDAAKKRKQLQEEEFNGVADHVRFVRAIGGKADEQTIQIPIGMPIGAYTWLGEQVYQLRDTNTLHYDDRATTRALAQNE